MKNLISFFFLSIFFSCASDAVLINGVKAPKLQLPDAEGNNISLLDLKGKIVLVDFWASWCQPCRKVNPKIVALYKKYKNTKSSNADGFEIYSISLDSNKDKWLKAIEKDQLSWPYHVSELTGWKSVAVEPYQVTSIPASYLIDQNGTIIGKNLHYKDLDKILSKRLIE